MERALWDLCMEDSNPNLMCQFCLNVTWTRYNIYMKFFCFIFGLCSNVSSHLYQELQLDEFVTHEVEFKDINKAFDLLNKGQCLRCVIWMEK
jgi:hypothetical protein